MISDFFLERSLCSENCIGGSCLLRTFLGAFCRVAALPLPCLLELEFGKAS
jgi:hypothetical protein